MADQPIMVWWSGEADEAQADEVLQLRDGPLSPQQAAADWWLDRCAAGVSYRGTDGHPVCVRWLNGRLYEFEVEIEPRPVAHARLVHRG